MKEKQVYKKIWPLPVKNFKKFFLWHQVYIFLPKCGSTRFCDQNCSVQPAELQTNRQTDVRRTVKSLKTEGPMILSIDIFYFKTVIIGGPISFCVS